MVDACGKDEEVTGSDVNPNPGIVGRITNVEISRTIRDEANFFVSVQMLSEEYL